jgi:hypothetical protein
MTARNKTKTSRTKLDLIIKKLLLNEKLCIISFLCKFTTGCINIIFPLKCGVFFNVIKFLKHKMFKINVHQFRCYDAFLLTVTFRKPQDVAIC